MRPLSGMLFSITIALFATTSVGAMTSKGHLFVGLVAPGSDAHVGVERYALVDGLPQGQGELYIPPPYGGLIAASAGGTLYVQAPSVGRFAEIAAFRYGERKPSRKVDIPLELGCYSGSIYPITAISTDRNGLLYVLLNTFFSDDFTRGRVHVRAPTWYLCEGVAIFGPGAQGHDPPRWTLPFFAYYLGGMASDDEANLYLDDGLPQSIVEFATVFAKPKVTRRLPGTGPYGEKIACDAAGNLYVLHNTSVAVYLPEARPANGSARLRNAFNLATGTYDAIVATERYVYVEDFSTSTLSIYDAHAVGNPLPVDSLTLPDAGFLTIGP